ncbi:MAG TPA: hypothetical protein PK087_01135 [Bacilli bacterium]|nr:MAG: Colicin V production protein [Tenericutes bacterium ADurb.BinA124]HNZ50402.1 hypothetical protein [Bacilli bacterium]HOH17904.1 hypothetical protein [Bacilli bacterium]HPX83808.1 hypothetical protein [Bacilli bacterium]HQC74251.1 hypothetical protein [Bacilli bacterium]
MEYFSTFNFDIIIVLVLLASLITGAYYSSFRQGRKTLMLIVPLVALYFVLPPLMKFIKSTSAVDNLLIKIVTFIGRYLKLSAYHNVMMTGLVALVAFIVMSLIIAFIYNLFAQSMEKQVLTSPTKFSRTLAALLGLINGYVLVILLMLLIKPVADINYHAPLSKLIGDTSTAYLPVSKLNEVQNINPTLHQEYQEAYDFISGNEVQNTLDYFVSLNDEFTDINTYIDTIMFNQLSTDSKALITAHLSGNDYVTALLTEVSGTLVLNTVLTKEKNHPEMTTIREKLSYLNDYRAYWTLFSTLLTDPIASYDYQEIATIYLNNQETLLSLFSQLRLRNDFIQKMNVLSLFAHYYPAFKTILNDNAAIDFTSYRTRFNLAMSNNLYKYAQAVVTYAFPERDNVVISLQTLFTEVLKQEPKMVLLDKNMGIPTQVILAKRYDEWFTTPLWETEVLINSYLLDSLGSHQTGGYPLYHEYFFFQYLSRGVTWDNQFSADDFVIMLNNLAGTVTNGLITSAQASAYLDGLLAQPQSVIRTLEQQGKMTATFYEELSLINHSLFSENWPRLLEVLAGE